MCTNMAGRYSQITCVCVHHMVEWHIWHICKNVIKTYVRHVSWSHVHPGWKSDQIKATPNTLITLRTPGAKMPPDHMGSSDHTCTGGQKCDQTNYVHVLWHNTHHEQQRGFWKKWMKGNIDNKFCRLFELAMMMMVAVKVTMMMVVVVISSRWYPD